MIYNHHALKTKYNIKNKNKIVNPSGILEKFLKDRVPLHRETAVPQIFDNLYDSKNKSKKSHRKFIIIKVRRKIFILLRKLYTK